ncbi:hypothetical protein V1525DRAFT_342213 [Lipomyces kononenkoae]|uniref:Uncharacterized protein n=1 Tax=Lipomyces kononenkoae TaxID=34357 RepID=A0ACC3T388_LIPKO
MVKKYRTNAKGYLRAGKIHQLMGNDLKARNVYQEGLKNIDSNDKLYGVMKQMLGTVSLRLSREQRRRAATSDPNDVQQPRNPRQPRDVMQLPVEIIEKILRYIPFTQLVKLQNVSKSWQKFLLNNATVWSVLDYRQCKKSIRCSTVRKCLQRAKGGVVELYLYNVLPQDDSIIGNEIAPYLLTARLQVLHVDFNVNIFLPSKRGHAMLDTQWRAFRNLTILKIAGCEMLESKELVEVICQAGLPSLRVLHFYGSAVTIPKRFPQLSEWNTTSFKPTILRSLIIDNSGGPMMTPTDDILMFLRLHPELISLSLSRFVLLSTPSLSTIDLANITPHLVELSLTNCSASSTPIVPPTCQKFVIANSSLIPRTTARHSNGVEVYSDGLNNIVPNPDEYRNLRHLDASSNNMLTDQDFGRVLSRCDGTVLQRLDLNGCPKITTASVFQISEFCSALRVLLIGQNSWLTDNGLAALHGLCELQYLDISSTDVTFTGVLRLLAGSDIDADGKRIPLTKLVARIQDDVKTFRKSAGDAGLRLPLQTLVMNSCTGISLQSSNWIRSLGVRVEHDLSSMYDYTNRNRKKRSLYYL